MAIEDGDHGDLARKVYEASGSVDEVVREMQAQDINYSDGEVIHYLQKQGLLESTIIATRIEEPIGIGFSLEEDRLMVSIYDKVEGNLAEGKRELDRQGLEVGLETLKKRWDYVGLEPAGRSNRKRPGRRITDDERMKIEKAHWRYDGKLQKAKDAMPYSKGLIKKVWEEAGLEINKNRRV